MPTNEEEMQLRIKKLRPTATIPTRATPGSAGLDLYADLGGDHPMQQIQIFGGRHAIIPCGISIEIPPGYEGQIRPRSGLAAKYGVTVLNSPGTLDSDYRNEVQVLLINHSKENYMVEHGDRIAQLVVLQVEFPEVVETNVLSETGRIGGFGSSGK